MCECKTGIWDFSVGANVLVCQILAGNLAKNWGLGSIGLECGYHHLSNWGTASCFVVLGKKKMVPAYDKEGNPDPHMVLPIGITLDERIADGYYYSGTMALVKKLLAEPELLEDTFDTPVEYAISRS